MNHASAEETQYSCPFVERFKVKKLFQFLKTYGKKTDTTKSSHQHTVYTTSSILIRCISSTSTKIMMEIKT